MASASTSKEYKLAIKIAGAVSSSFDSAIGEAGQKIANLGSIAQVRKTGGCQFRGVPNKRNGVSCVTCCGNGVIYAT